MKRHSIATVLAVATSIVGLAYVSAPASGASYTLRIASGHPAKPLAPVNAASRYFVPTVTARVANETGHTVKFIEAYAGTLANMFETLESTQKGLVDIGLWCVCFEPAKAALHNFNFYIPWTTSDPALQQKLTRQIYDEFPVLYGTLEKRYGQKVLGIAAFDDYGLGTTFAWTEPGELKGHKIAGAGPNLPWLRFAGATPVQTKLPEAYRAMQSGVYDGLILFPATWFGFKFHEVAPYWTEMGWGAMAVYIMTVNLERFSSLPKEIQSILIEEGRNWEAENAKEGVRRHAIGLKKLREAGATVRRLPRKAQIDMARALRDWPDSKAKELDKAGFPGTAIFRRYIELAKKSGVEFPVDYPIR